MKKIIFILILLLIFAAGVFVVNLKETAKNYGAPPDIEDKTSPPQNMGRYGDLSKWVRPQGPLRVGLQAGHWKNKELPDELKRLRETGGGTSNGAVAEWEVNLAIAQATKSILEKEGIIVDILPATIPPGYYGDAVVAIHADGSKSPATNGFKAAAPRRDLSGKGSELVKIINETYQKFTKQRLDPNISRNMTGYYAFSWRRFEHTTHPMAPAVILETGFLTNPTEAKMLINQPDLPAKGIAASLMAFFNLD